MTKVHDSFHGRRFAAMHYCPSFLHDSAHSIADSIDDSNRSDAVKDFAKDGENDAMEFEGAVIIPRSTSKFANAANDETKITSSQTLGRSCHFT